MLFIRRRRTASALLAAFFVAALVDGLGSPLSPDWAARALSAEQRSGLDWVAGHADVAHRYLVVSGERWAEDATAEWFPILADSRSVATVQGTEWIGTETFNKAIHASEDLRDCAVRTASCIEEWAAVHGVEFTHVYIPKGPLDGPLGKEECCMSLRETMRSDPRYRPLYDGVGASVFERRGGGEAASTLPYPNLPMFEGFSALHPESSTRVQRIP